MSSSSLKPPPGTTVGASPGVDAASSGVGMGGSFDAAGPGADAAAPGIDVAVTTGPAPDASGSACAPLQLHSNARIAAYDTDQFVWQDSRCKPRQAALVRVGGGYVRQFVYDLDGTPRVCTGTGANGNPGWGYTVDHWGGTATSGKDVPGAFRPLFVGPHHALYEYSFPLSLNNQKITVTQHWFFATGRDNPVLATTYDVSAAPPGSVNADTRTPYGDLAWNGDDNSSGTVVDGVGWGDRYKFVTTSAPLTMNGKWDYAQPNTVPYVLEWTVKTNAEMGAVQTQTFLQHDAGGYWFYDNWGKTSDNPGPKKQGQAGLMPVTWNWTYQLDQYELCLDDPNCLGATTGSHRLAWGTNYGAIGGANAGSGNYPAYGDDKMLSGYPFQSYSVFMVLGKHSDAPVARQVSEIETVQSTHLTAGVGSVPVMGPGGVGRTDAVALAPAGYDHRYAVWTAAMAGGRLALHVVVARGRLDHPILMVTGYAATAAPKVSIDGVAQLAGALPISVDAMAKQAWVTFPAGWTGAHDITVE